MALGGRQNGLACEHPSAFSNLFAVVTRPRFFACIDNGPLSETFSTDDVQSCRILGAVSRFIVDSEAVHEAGSGVALLAKGGGVHGNGHGGFSFSSRECGCKSPDVFSGR